MNQWNSSRSTPLTQPAGSKFTKVSSKAVTFSGGVKLGGIIGIEVSARTGYESDARLFFDFNKKRKLCGQYADPGGPAKTLVVRAGDY